MNGAHKLLYCMCPQKLKDHKSTPTNIPLMATPRPSATPPPAPDLPR